MKIKNHRLKLINSSLKMIILTFFYLLYFLIIDKTGDVFNSIPYYAMAVFIPYITISITIIFSILPNKSLFDVERILENIENIIKKSIRLFIFCIALYIFSVITSSDIGFLEIVSIITYFTSIFTMFYLIYIASKATGFIITMWFIL